MSVSGSSTLVLRKKKTARPGLLHSVPPISFRDGRSGGMRSRGAGLEGSASYLNREERQVALGLAINWGMRLLLAYAVECYPPNKEGVKRIV
jgi:hypothetical protein